MFILRVLAKSGVMSRLLFLIGMIDTFPIFHLLFIMVETKDILALT